MSQKAFHFKRWGTKIMTRSMIDASIHNLYFPDWLLPFCHRSLLRLSISANIIGAGRNWHQRKIFHGVSRRQFLKHCEANCVLNLSIFINSLHLEARSLVWLYAYSWILWPAIITLWIPSATKANILLHRVGPHAAHDPCGKVSQPSCHIMPRNWCIVMI